MFEPKPPNAGFVGSAGAEPGGVLFMDGGIPIPGGLFMDGGIPPGIPIPGGGLGAPNPPPGPVVMFVPVKVTPQCGHFEKGGVAFVVVPSERPHDWHDHV